MEGKACLAIVLAAIMATSVVAFAPEGLGGADVEIETAVFVVHSLDAGARAYLIERGGEVIVEYESFALARATPTVFLELEALGYTAYPISGYDTVTMDRFVVDPSSRRSVELNEGRELGIIRLIGPPKSEWIEQLQDSGIRLREYLPRYAYVAQGNIQRALAFEFVSWVEPLRPEYKLSGSLSSGPGTGLQRVRVMLYDLDSAERIANEIEEMGGRIVQQSKRDLSLIHAEVSAEAIAVLAQDPSVRWIEAVPQLSLFNTDATWVLQSAASTQYDRSVFARGVTGSGQIVAIADSGVNMEHPAFEDPAVECPPLGMPRGGSCTGHRKVVAYIIPGDAEAALDGGAHGTHVAGTVGGDAGVWNSYSGCEAPGDPCDTDVERVEGPQDGNAFEAKLVVVDMGVGDFLSGPSDLWDVFDEAYNLGARVHSNSWGVLSTHQHYSVDAFRIDQFAWDHKDLVIVFAAGNSGPQADTIHELAQAKNTVIVGATLNADLSNQMPNFSSRGLAFDDRIRPTVVAPGSRLFSANEEYGRVPLRPPYADREGTSMSTPGIAGAAALIRDYFESGYYPSGQAVAADSFAPSAALVRALLVNGAREITDDSAYTNGFQYPNADQGWGRVNLEDALYFAGDSRQQYVHDEPQGFMTGDRAVFKVELTSAAGQPLEVTLAWTDYPGSVGTSRALVNDLNLQVVSPTGSKYWGNLFAGFNPGQSAPGGTPDSLNVEENVLLLNPPLGTYYVIVSGASIAFGPQPFALAVTGGSISASRVSDSEAPTVSSFLVDGGNAYTRVRQVSLGISATDPDSGVDVMRFRNEDAQRGWRTVGVSAESTHGTGAVWVGRQHVLEPFDPAEQCLLTGRIETPHPYPGQAGTDTWDLICIREDRRLRIGFERIELASKDKVEVFDAAGALRASWSGPLSLENVWTSEFVSTHAKVVFTRFGIDSAWGFLGWGYAKLELCPDNVTPPPCDYDEDQQYSFYVVQPDAHKMELVFEFIHLAQHDELWISDALGIYTHFTGPWQASNYTVRFLFGNEIWLLLKQPVAGSGTAPGYRVNFARVFAGYAKDTNADWIFRDPGATQIQGHFERLNIGAGETLRYFDAQGTEYFCPCDPGFTPVIPGDTLIVRFQAGGHWVTDWGFRIDWIRAWNYPWNPYGWEDYGTSRSWTLSDGDGLNTVTMQLRDGAGNVREASDTIFLDTVTPSFTDFNINNNAESATWKDVTLSLTASDPSPSSGLLMRFRDNDAGGTGTWTAWETFSATRSWTLDGYPGTQCVDAEIRDNAGNQPSMRSDCIYLEPDTVAPSFTGFNINNGASETASASVTLYITASDPTPSSGMLTRYRNYDPEVGGSWTPWESYRAVRSWTLDGYGEQCVQAEVKDRADNHAGMRSDCINYFQDRPEPPGGTPYAAPWNGVDYVSENNILPLSEDFSRGALEVEDRYLFESALVPVDGHYSIQIREFERERSYLDTFELMTVDHESNVRIAFSPDGDLLTYRAPRGPIGATDQDGRNVKALLLNPGDDRDFEGYRGDSVVLRFKTYDGGAAKLILRTDIKPPGPESLNIAVRVSGDWQSVATLIPRAQWAYNAVDLAPFLVEGSATEVRISWTDHHKLDYVGLDTSDEESVTVTTYGLAFASHSVLGDVTDLLMNDDDVYAELQPGEHLVLGFPYEGPSPGVRDIVLVSRGYYVMKYQPVAGFDHAGNDRAVHFTAAVMEGVQGDHYDIPAVAFHWNFGDGGTGTGMEVSHAYEKKGRYDVILLVVWEDGSEQTFSRVVRVK